MMRKSGKPDLRVRNASLRGAPHHDEEFLASGEIFHAPAGLGGPHSHAYIAV